MLKENKSNNISFLSFFTLFFFIFTRTFIIIPENFFGISIGLLQFDFRVENVLFLVLLMVYSFLFSYVLILIYSKKRQTMLPLIGFILFDCVFFALLDDCLKLFVVILGLLCVLNALSTIPLIKTSITVPLFMFVSAVLDWRFIFSFCLLAFIIFLVCNVDNNSNKKSKTIFISVACTLAGVLINLALTNLVEPVNTFFNRLSFVDVIPTYKGWETFVSFIPPMVIGYVVYENMLKVNKKLPLKMRSKAVALSVDLIGIAYPVALLAFFIFRSEAFMTINLIVPIMLIICTLKDDNVVVGEISNVLEKIERHKTLALFVAVIVFYWCFGFMDGYNDGNKIVNFIRY